jgi:hypothetical protein
MPILPATPFPLAAIYMRAFLFIIIISPLLSFGQVNDSRINTKDSLFNQITVRVGNLKDTLLSVRQILLQPYLSVMNLHAVKSERWFIAGFSTLIFRKEDDSQFIETGELRNLSAKQIAYIRTLKKGDTIHFDDIRGERIDGRNVKLPSFTVVIQ